MVTISKPTPGQLPLPWTEEDIAALPTRSRMASAQPKIPRLCEVVVPIEPTFDVSQGIREVVMNWAGADRLTVTLDARHLELAEHCGGVIFDPLEPYMVGVRNARKGMRGHGSFINPAIFLNVLRCISTIYGRFIAETGNKPDFIAIPPREGTRARQLWDAVRVGDVIARMGEPGLLGQLPIFEFDSRYISPILIVTQADENRQQTIERTQEWIFQIEARLGPMMPDLIKVVPEIVTNLVNHGQGGQFIVSVWPSGQVEILWSNRLDRQVDWPSEDTPEGVANSLRYHNKGGDGTHYIFDQLLPRYNGVLVVNYKGSDVVFSTGQGCEIFGRDPRPSFLPRSILFTLELFNAETQRGSV